MHLADAFIQSDLQCIQAILFFVSMCVPWELNPQPLRIHSFDIIKEVIRQLFTCFRLYNILMKDKNWRIMLSNTRNMY